MGQTTDLASRYPDRVRNMAKLFDEQVTRYNVAPMHNLSDAAADGREVAKQDYIRREGLWTYPGPVSNITGALAPPVNVQGFFMTAKLDLPSGTETGPIFAYGGQLSGIGLYLVDGRPSLILNALSGESETIAAARTLGAG